MPPTIHAFCSNRNDQVMTPGMRVPIGTYLTYGELFGSSCTLESFRQFLTKYDRSQVLHLCALINCLIRTWHGAHDKQAHDELAAVAFRPELLDYITNHARNPKPVIFHRLQTLFVAKEAVLYGSDDGIDPLNSPHWGGFGQAFVMANDHLHQELPESNQTLRRLTQYLSINEYSSPWDLRALLARGNLTFTKFPTPLSDFNIRDSFAQASGMNLDQFRVMCLGVICQYFLLDGETYKEDKKRFLIGPDFFGATTIPQEVVDKFLGEMSRTAKELETSFEERNEGPLDFTQFRDKPLVRVNKAYFPIDMRFLVEKLEGGVFWKVNALLDHHSGSSLHSAWGKGVESYCNWLLSESTDGHTNVLLESPTYIETSNQVTDAIVLCGDKAVFIECKTAMMRSETKYGGQAARLAEEIYRNFVESNERPQAVKQLALAINTVFNKDTPRPVKGLDVGAIRKVYPLILTKDSIGGSIGFSKYLRNFFKPLIKDRLLTVHVMPLFCLSVDQFEEIAEVLEVLSIGV